MRVLILLFAALGLSACAAVVPLEEGEIGAASVSRIAAPLLPTGVPAPTEAADNFIAVVDKVEPVAERLCRAEAAAEQCDFQIVVDSRPEMPPNAFQTVDPSGRPIIGFTIALIADARNRDELAFILGHEAAHHIAGHIPIVEESARQGALLASTLASIQGAGTAELAAAQKMGSFVGARAFSKELELEADALGAVIAYRAGFDPLVGAQFFERIADPGRPHRTRWHDLARTPGRWPQSNRSIDRPLHPLPSRSERRSQPGVRRCVGHLRGHVW
jgi:Zn-dependent protease with chaperone function